MPLTSPIMKFLEKSGFLVWILLFGPGTNIQEIFDSLAQMVLYNCKALTISTLQTGGVGAMLKETFWFGVNDSTKIK